MLSIWVLNAGKGDSIVLHYDGPNGSTFAVIDSNRHGAVTPALKKLKELGAKRISFVALTHPHADHYSGLADVLDAYAGAIDNFYTYPIDRENSDRLNKLTKICRQIHQSTDGKTVKRQIVEFLEILKHGKRIGLDNWEEITGYRTQLFPSGFDGVELWGILPPAKVKGDYFQRIDSGDVSVLDQKPDLNRLSIAFSISYEGIEIILGGDGTYENWMDHKRAWGRIGKTPSALVVKLPHHGSKKDCAPDVIDYVFADRGERIAAISANGRSHPHEETYAALEERNIKPYCTNLATQCGANIHTMLTVPDLDPVLRRYLASYSEPAGAAIQPCQGDIEVRIDVGAEIKVIPQFNHACPYRIPDMFP